MSTEERSRVMDLWGNLRHTGTEEGLRRFASPDLITQSRQHGLSFAAMAGLRQYARCRAWALFYRRTGQVTLARREAALAGVQTRILRSL